MECTFAINSTAPGFVVIQDEHSQYTINTTLQRQINENHKGSTNITGIQRGNYTVSVHDEVEDRQSAYEMQVQLVGVPVTQPVDSHSSYTTSVMPVLFSSGSYQDLTTVTTILHNYCLLSYSCCQFIFGKNQHHTYPDHEQ